MQKIFNRSSYKDNIKRFTKCVQQQHFLYSLADQITQEIIDDLQRPVNDALIYNPLMKSSLKVDATTTYLTIEDYDEDDFTIGLNQYDLIVTTLSLHLVNNLIQALSEYHKALRPGGVFVATILGGNSFQKLRQACIKADLSLYDKVFPRIMPCIELHNAAKLLQQTNFDMVLATSEHFTASYSNIADMIRDIREMGHSNCLTQRKHSLESKQYLAILKDSFEAGNIINNFEIITMTGIKSEKKDNSTKINQSLQSLKLQLESELCNY
jgi:SAM-dependent methyltransferase